jgi:hypothetical protein
MINIIMSSNNIFITMNIKQLKHEYKKCNNPDIKKIIKYVIKKKTEDYDSIIYNIINNKDEDKKTVNYDNVNNKLTERLNNEFLFMAELQNKPKRTFTEQPYIKKITPATKLIR